MARIAEPAPRTPRGAGRVQAVAMVVVTLTVAALLLAGCASPGREQGASVVVSCDQFQQTGQQHLTRTVDLTVGGELHVTLCANPSTGFQWEDAAVADATVLSVTDHHYTAPAGGTPPLAGAPGQDEWTIKALKAGQTTVAFRYSRPWTGGEQGVWTLDLTVNVAA